MEKTSTPHSSPGTPYPKYLICSEARKLIAEIEAAACMVEIVAPAPGSVSVQITTTDEQTHTEIGRSDDLEHMIRVVAEECGLSLE